MDQDMHHPNSTTSVTGEGERYLSCKIVHHSDFSTLAVVVSFGGGIVRRDQPIPETSWCIMQREAPGIPPGCGDLSILIAGITQQPPQIGFASTTRNTQNRTRVRLPKAVYFFTP